MTISQCAATLFLITFAAGCHHERAKGPAERAGEGVDNAARDTKDAVDDAKHDVKRDLKK